MINVRFKLLNNDATQPTKAHDSDAGLDFYSSEDIVIPYKGSVIVSTGVAWSPIFDPKMYKFPHEQQYVREISEWYNIYLKLESRSGLSINHDIEVGAGVVDQSYRGEFRIKLYNNSNVNYNICKGDRIAQGIVYILPKIKVTTYVGELDSTDRNDSGYGSSGK